MVVSTPGLQRASKDDLKSIARARVDITHLATDRKNCFTLSHFLIGKKPRPGKAR